MFLTTLKHKKCVKRRLKKRHRLKKYVPDHFKTQKMCENVVKKNPNPLAYIPNYFKIQEMCNKTVDIGLWQLRNIYGWFQIGL